MKHKKTALLMILALTAILAAPSAFAQSLGSAQSFAVLGYSTVTNTGPSVITGNVGTSNAGSSITGFPPGIIAGGALHPGDAVAGQAQTDVTAAYNTISGTACNVDLSGLDLGSQTLTPGVYCYSSSANLTGTLRLDFQGNPNAVFLFKIGSTLTTASNSSVLLLNSGGSTCPPNLFFQVGSSATFGTGSTFIGNILAQASITLTTGARLTGRALARTGAVTLDTNNVTPCGSLVSCPVITVNPPTLPNGTVGTPYNQTVSALGAAPPVTFSVTSGALPAGLLLNSATGLISGTPSTFGTNNFTITATDLNGCAGSRAYTIIIAQVGCPPIALSPSAVPAAITGTFYNQTIVASGGVAPYTFVLGSGSLPTGLTLSSSGVLSGIPSAPGIFNFSIRATDANGCAGMSINMSISVVVGSGPVSGPTLGTAGLMILVGLLAVAGMFVINRFSA